MVKKNRKFVWVSDVYDWDITNSSFDTLSGAYLETIEECIIRDDTYWPGEGDTMVYYNIKLDFDNRKFKIINSYTRKEAERIVKIKQL